MKTQEQKMKEAKIILLRQHNIYLSLMINLF
jgi:hypothetical protein